MIDFYLPIIEDLRLLINSKKINENISKSIIDKNLKLFSDLMIKKYNSIYNYLNNINSESTDRKSFCTDNNGFKIKMNLYKDGSYVLSILYKIEANKKFNGIYLKNEFKRECGFVYFIKSEFGWKIGKTKNIDNRIKIFEVKLPFDFELKYYIKTIDYHKLEIELHNLINYKNINGEWFDLSKSDFEYIHNFLDSKNYKLINAKIKTNLITNIPLSKNENN